MLQDKMSLPSSAAESDLDDFHPTGQSTRGHLSLPGPSPSPSATVPTGSVHRFKLVLLGESGVGKTSLAHRFVRDQFSEQFDSTIGSAFFAPTIWAGEAEGPVKLEIWDTAGQERYRSLAPLYYRGAHAALIVYDLCNKNSFAKVKGWIDELNGQGRRDGDGKVLLGLVGNKADLAEDGRKVPWKEAQTCAAEHGLMFIETSAKTAQNVNELFVATAKKLVENKTKANREGERGFPLSGENGEKEKTLCCQ